MTATFTKTSRHGRHYESADREILVVTRRYPGENLVWSHVRPRGSTDDFYPVTKDPHGGPGSVSRVVQAAEAFEFDSPEFLLWTLEAESKRHWPDPDDPEACAVHGSACKSKEAAA